MEGVDSNHGKKNYNTVFERGVSAALGATISSLLVTPLDVVKVRMQSQENNSSYDHDFRKMRQKVFISQQQNVLKNRITGVMQGVWTIGRTEGLTGLYRGLGPSLIMAMPSTIAYLLSYETIKNLLISTQFNQKFNFFENFTIREHISSVDSMKNYSGSVPIEESENNFHSKLKCETESVYSNAAVPAIAGCCARIFAVTLTSPAELLRTLMQAKGETFPIAVKKLSQRMRLKGPQVLYRGLQPTLWRDVPFSGIYWASYECLRVIYANSIIGLANKLNKDPPKRLDIFSSFGAGASAGAFAAALTTPFDVAKTHAQVLRSSSAPISIFTHLSRIWTDQGIAGVTRGIVPRMAKVAPACAIMISTYEFGKSQFAT